MARTAGLARNGRDSNAKRRGVKRYAGELVKCGSIIVRQCGTPFKVGHNVGIGRDNTIFALIDGRVKFDGGKRVSVYPV